MDWLPTIGGIIIALLGGGLGALLLWRSTKRKTDADAASIITQTALAIVRQYESRVEILEERAVQQDAEIRVLRAAQGVFADQVERLTTENMRLRSEVRALKAQLKEVTAQNAQVWGGAEILARQVEGFGEEPAWKGLPAS